jgi:SAM-dependent methyltransferase
MSKTLPPVRCLLCNASGGILPAEFRQIYPQKDSAPVLLDWWQCCACEGWFVCPAPTPEVIERHWPTVAYNDPKLEIETARVKEGVQRRLLLGISRWTKPGTLLDFGCNFGQFMLMARETGWTPSGFEPSETAAEIARAKGFDVRQGWSLEEADFAEGSFSAITANDVFSLVWHPIATLETFHRLLKPSGVLAMRLTNKRFILELVRAFSPKGMEREARISRILQAQLHSIGLTPLRRILRGLGFDRIRIQPRAMTAPWNALGWRTRIAYLGADIVYFLLLTKVNLSPGILLFARKALP